VTHPSQNSTNKTSVQLDLFGLEHTTTESEPVPNANKKPRKKRQRFPKHKAITRSYKFAMDVSLTQSKRFFAVCDLLLDVRNKLVVKLSDNRRINREHKAAGRLDQVHYTTSDELKKRVGEWAKDDNALKELHSHLLQDVVDRIDEGTQRWLDAIKHNRNGVKPPRCKDKRKYRSFTYKQYSNGCRIQNHRVFLSKLGWFKLFDHRKMEGRPTAITIKFQHGRWWCIVTCQGFAHDWFEPFNLDTDTRPDMGGDPGLTSLLTTSDGTTYDPPRAFKNAQKKLAGAQRTMSRKFRIRKTQYETAVKGKTEDRKLKDIPYSNRLKAVIRKVGKQHTKVVNIRDNEQKKIAARLQKQVRRLGVEEHPVMFMIRNRKTAKSASDRAIFSMKKHIASALGPKRYFPTSNQRPGIGGNSQTCICGAKVPKELKDRIHDCSACRLVAPRDFVSGNIVQTIAFGSVHESFQKLIDAAGLLKLASDAKPSVETETTEKEFPNTESAGGQPVVMRGEVRMQDRREPLAEPAVAIPMASEPSMKRKPPTSPRKRIPPGGQPTGGRQNCSKLKHVAIRESLPAEPQLFNSASKDKVKKHRPSGR
jgi:transposase